MLTFWKIKEASLLKLFQKEFSEVFVCQVKKNLNLRHSKETLRQVLYILKYLVK